MSKSSRSRGLVVLLTAVGAVAGLAYALAAKPVFESVASVVLYRDRVENPNSVSEDAKNRWVWVRDGLTLTEGLLSDDFFESVVKKSPPLQARFDAFRNSLVQRHGLPASEEAMLQFAHGLRKSLRIDYTGGDSNTFVFKARDASPAVARELAQAMVDRLRELWVTERHDMAAAALAAIAKDVPPGEAGLESRSYLRNTYNGLLVSARLADVLAARNFQVVRRPSLPLDPLWPRRSLIVALGALVGLLAGLFLGCRECFREPG